MPDATAPATTVVSNTSPLLYLHQIHQLYVLEQLYGRVLVPSLVLGELAEGRSRGADVPNVSEYPWLTVLPLSLDEIDSTVRKLGAGEAGAITLGLRSQPSLILLDDQPARRAARSHGLTVTGTLGVLIKAKKTGILEAVAPLLETLGKTTMWLPDDLIELVLEEAGER